MPDEYAYFSVGIKAIQGHVFDGGINGENVCVYASEIMYLATCLLTGQKEYERITKPEIYRDVKLPIKGIKPISSIPNINPLG